VDAGTGLVSDFDFHPDEADVREFRFRQTDVLRFDDAAFVCATGSDGVVLRHYAFADEWFSAPKPIVIEDADISGQGSHLHSMASCRYSFDISTTGR